MKSIRIRLFQISLSPTVHENLDKVEKAVSIPFRPGKTGHSLPKHLSEKTAHNHFDFLVLPELFTTGYHSKEKMKSLSEDLNGPTVDALKKITKQYGIALAAGSYIENREGIIHNTSLAIDRKGRLTGTYRKTHLFTVLKEDKLLSPGNEIDVFKIEKIVAGTLTCFEIRFPEIARKLALMGAQILFCPVEWSHPKSEILLTLARARAIENQVFLALANIVGKSGGLDFCGGSMVIAPDGTVLARGSEDKEEIIDMEIDLKLINIYRKQIPALSLRREDLYRLRT
jgi:omega-amidase